MIGSSPQASKNRWPVAPVEVVLAPGGVGQHPVDVEDHGRPGRETRSRQRQFSPVGAHEPSEVSHLGAREAFSARLDAVGSTERLTLPIPYGHRVYVVSDLSLSPTTDETSRPIRELIDLLGDIDDPAVRRGGRQLLAPRAHVGPREVRRRHPGGAARAAVTPSSRSPHEGHRFIVLPGSDDHELRTTAAEATLERSASPGQRRDPAARDGRRRAGPPGRGRHLHGRPVRADPTTATTPTDWRTPRHWPASSRRACSIADSAPGSGSRCSPWPSSTSRAR
jgi:hypothetical protein